jgi:hypothetical protein
MESRVPQKQLAHFLEGMVLYSTRNGLACNSSRHYFSPNFIRICIFSVEICMPVYRFMNRESFSCFKNKVGLK